MDVCWVVLLEMDSSLRACGPGQHIHILPSILDLMRIMAIISVLKTAMQTDNMVGQCVFPICGLNIPGIPVAGIQLFVRP